MPQYADLPVIMVTSEAARYNVIEALKVGRQIILLSLEEKSFKESLSKIKSPDKSAFFTWF